MLQARYLALEKIYKELNQTTTELLRRDGRWVEDYRQLRAERDQLARDKTLIYEDAAREREMAKRERVGMSKEMERIKRDRAGMREEMERIKKERVGMSEELERAKRERSAMSEELERAKRERATISEELERPDKTMFEGGGGPSVKNQDARWAFKI